MSLNSLESLVAAASTVTLEEPAPGYPVLRVENASASASVALHGAHVLTYQPHGTAPVLYLSPTARFEEGVPVRGGIPICWPWFGDHPTESEWPAHGVARNRFWQLCSIDETTDEVTVLRFILPEEVTPEALRPGAFALEFVVRIGAELELALTTTNRGTTPFSVGDALHSYFAIGDLPSVRIEGLSGCTYQDSILGRVGDQVGPIVFDRHINRIYEATGPSTSVVDPAGQRRIAIEAVGSATTVVWNAWTTQAEAFKDMPDDGYRNFVCVETANAASDVREIAPGGSHTLGCRISVESAGD